MRERENIILNCFYFLFFIICVHLLKDSCFLFSILKTRYDPDDIRFRCSDEEKEDLRKKGLMKKFEKYTKVCCSHILLLLLIL